MGKFFVFNFCIIVCNLFLDLVEILMVLFWIDVWIFLNLFLINLVIFLVFFWVMFFCNLIFCLILLLLVDFILLKLNIFKDKFCLVVLVCKIVWIVFKLNWLLVLIVIVFFFNFNVVLEFFKL